jgi:glycosyltransferase involved in cell wall biosynthesis
MRIAMIGQRGVPATFGGVEHHVEELGSRLAARGHDVTVFVRPSYSDYEKQSYRGMTVRRVPTVSTRHLDAIVHASLSTVAAMRTGFDIIHYHAIGPGVPGVLPRMGGRSRVIQTIHGLDGQRAKWGPVAQSALGAAEWMSSRVPHEVIVVSRDLQSYYRDRYQRDTHLVYNGVNERTIRSPQRIVDEYGLEKHEYVLFVGRLVPEKAPDKLIRAFRRIPGDRRLVIAGGSSFTGEYVEQLHQLASQDPRVLLTGYVYGEVLDELYSNAAVFVLPSLLEGLPLTLLEAIAYGAPIVASDIPPHQEVIDSSRVGHMLFTTGNDLELVDALQETLDSQQEALAAADAFRERTLPRFRWDEVARATESVYTNA